jgi:hypothetical protein
MRGAGGTPGGTFLFPVGIIMMCGGFYLLLSSIVIRAQWGLGYSLYNFGGFGITSGMVMIPFLFGVGIVFYDSRNKLGWVLAIGSLVALIFCRHFLGTDTTKEAENGSHVSVRSRPLHRQPCACE